MPISTDVTNLKVNVLTQAQYDTAVQAGTITANEISLITDGASQTIQMSTMPTASASELGNIYQYIGETNQDYINGYFYKCVSDGNEEESGELDPITVIDYEGKEDDLAVPSIMFDKVVYDNYDPEHPELTGGESFSLYTGEHGDDENIVEYAAVGFVEDSYSTETDVINETVLEAFARMGFYITFDEEYDFVPSWISCTMPAEFSYGGNSSYSWQQVNVQPGSSPLYPSTMPVLYNDAWEEDQETGELTQTLSNISEVTANNVVMVSPSPVSADLYAYCGVLCIAQGNGTLTFKCDTLPDDIITVTVICF